MFSLLAAADAVPVPPLSLELRIPLSVLHFLQIGIWGAWWVSLGQYLAALDFSRKWIGRIYATIPLASMISPLLFGTIADRYVETQYVLGALNLLGGVLLLWLTKVRTPGKFFWITMGYALLFAPTLALINSIVFSHISDGARDFPTIRVFGTLGWIAAGMSLSVLLPKNSPVNHRPITLAAVCSLLLGAFCFVGLPHTPVKSAAPAVAAENATVAPESSAAATSGEGTADHSPFMRALALFGHKELGIFFVVSFLVAVGLSFYFSFASLYIEREVKVQPNRVASLMSLGQWVEVVLILNLEYFINHLGMKTVLFIGMGSWAVRYLILGLAHSFPLIVVAILLHGFCFDFFLAAGFVHVDSVVKGIDPSIVNSAQSLFSTLTYGLGMYFGTELAGWLNQKLTVESTGPAGETISRTNWRLFWLVPFFETAIPVVLFLLLSP